MIIAIGFPIISVVAISAGFDALVELGRSGWEGVAIGLGVCFIMAATLVVMAALGIYYY